MNIHLKSILSAIAFSILFYSKSLGLNLFLIAIIVIILLFSIKKNRPVPWGYAGAYGFSALMVIVNPAPFQIAVHFLTLLVFVGKSVSQRGSLYISALVGLVNMLLASLINLGENPNRTKRGSKTFSKKAYLYFKGTSVALVLVFFFVLLYRKANPIFNNLISQIDLSFIDVPWVFFTILGYFLFRHLLAPFDPKELVEQDQSISNELTSPKTPFTQGSLKKLKEEHTLGSMVLGTLNFLLLFFLITDVLYLLQPQTVVPHSQYSEAVHEGVYALSFSVICAIALIIYFFRGNLNFYAQNNRLKTLSFVWIGLNVLLVVFTCIKNYHYIAELGLTYKRIGVFVYLLLTLIGLVTAYFKVIQIKSFMYLFRTNISVAFTFLVIGTAVPWDRTITAYNLAHLNTPDIEYLFELNPSNSVQLYDYAKRNNSISQTLKDRISNRLTYFKEEQATRSWQEYTIYQFALNP